MRTTLPFQAWNWWARAFLLASVFFCDLDLFSAAMSSKDQELVQEGMLLDFLVLVLVFWCVQYGSSSVVSSNNSTW